MPRNCRWNNDKGFRGITYSIYSIKLLKELSYVDNIKIDGNKITANVIGNDEDVVNLLKYLVLKDIPVLNYSRAVGNLEDVFIQITADSDEEGA